MKFPKRIYVYVFNTDDDGKSVYAVETDGIENLDPDMNGDPVASYRLDDVQELHIHTDYSLVPLKKK